MAALAHHDWPGNVRELENCIERACALSTGELIDLDDLPEHVSRAAPPPAAPLDLAGRKGDAERAAILEALQRAGHNRSKAARLLGMGRSTLYRKMAQLGIAPGRGDG
jgi:transcriptional regulator of acetoin/glycerol metabolism